MPLTVKLETERGERLEELYFSPAYPLDDLLPPLEDTSYQCWRFINPYGNTIFNRLQMEQFLTELERIRQLVTEPEYHDMLDSIQELAHQCQRAWHYYLKFYGD